MGNGSAARAATWLLRMALPVLALWLLLVRRQLCLAWDNRMAHFVLVFAAAIVSTVLGALIGKGASARDDAACGVCGPRAWPRGPGAGRRGGIGLRR